jgi:hypothetical protein
MNKMEGDKTMVARKKKNKSEKDESNGRIKVGKLRVNKETVKDLTSDETQKVKGGTGVCAGSQIAAGLTSACVASPEAPPPRPGGQIPPTVIRLLCT